MQNNYQYNILNPNLDTLGYVVAIANMKDKHDRSAPSHFHWKILKCRMIIFSSSSILACPDKNDLQQVHILFNKVGGDYDKLNSLFLKFSLTQDGAIRKPTSEVFQMCFQYTMMAKIAPSWNTLGYNYLINNRDFLTTPHPQEGVRCHFSSDDNVTVLALKPVKIHLLRADEDFFPGEWIRVFPRLFGEGKHREETCTRQRRNSKAYVKSTNPHWVSVVDYDPHALIMRHGYRLPEKEGSYCTVQFWRGEPLTYPKICITRNFPIITPMPKSEEKVVLSRFLGCLRSKMSHILGVALSIQQNYEASAAPGEAVNEMFSETQAVSLCTPTQYQRSSK